MIMSLHMQLRKYIWYTYVWQHLTSSNKYDILGYHFTLSQYQGLVYFHWHDTKG